MRNLPVAFRGSGSVVLPPQADFSGNGCTVDRRQNDGGTSLLLRQPTGHSIGVGCDPAESLPRCGFGVVARTVAAKKIERMLTARILRRLGDGQPRSTNFGREVLAPTNFGR